MREGDAGLRALAGAVLCVGVPGTTLGAEERAALEELRPAGIILFARNVSTLEGTRALVAGVRAAAGGSEPALVCVDQEGGRVLRLPFARDAMPAMLALGATGDEALARRAGVRLARELGAIGANVDFAPVLDVLSAGASSVTGTRSFGDDPALVARMGAALIGGLQAEGAVATAKHFPGHGATALDSHVALPVLETDLATLHARELPPFRAAIAAGVRAVMSAHVIVRALDERNPATLSRRVLHDLLRGELGFDGVVFTDCLEMDAIARGVGTAAAAALALAAGADVALISHDLALARAARDAIVTAVRAGDLPLERLSEAAARVAALRAWAAPAALARDDAAEERDEIAREIARRAVVRVRGDAVLREDRPVTVVSFEGDLSDGIARAQAERPSLALALRRRRLRAESMRVPLDPNDELIANLVEIVRAHGERDIVAVARRAARVPNQQRALAALFAAAPHAIGVAALEPYDVAALAGASTVYRTHGDEQLAIDALAAALCDAGMRA